MRERQGSSFKQKLVKVAMELDKITGFAALWKSNPFFTLSDEVL